MGRGEAGAVVGDDIGPWLLFHRGDLRCRSHFDDDRVTDADGAGQHSRSVNAGARPPGCAFHMLAMSFSTRSSTERNGSLHSTVR
jgi:hypothetical protein